MRSRLSRLFAFLMILALVAPTSLAPSGAAPVALADMGQIETASSAFLAKMHPKLQAAAAAAAPDDTIAIMVHALPGTDLGRYMGRLLVRPYVLPNGTQAYFGTVRVAQLGKIASLPQVAYLQEMRSVADAPIPLAPEPDGAAAGAGSVRAADWFDVGDVNKARAAWAVGYTGQGVKVMVNDSGIDFAHPDLQGTQARITDPASPYYGWPIAFDSASMLSLAYDYYLGTTFIKDGIGVTGAAPDYADTSTTRSGADLTTNEDGSLSASFQPIAATVAHTYTFSPTSKSGVYHFGSHPDTALMKTRPPVFTERWAVLVVDEAEAGVYDTVYVDLDGDFDFRNEKPARKGSEEIYRDLNGDGYADRSGGSIYWISDGVNPLPVSDWLWGMGADVAGPGDLVAFTVMDTSESGGDHGQLCASNVAGQGVIDGNAPVTKPSGDGTPGTGMVLGTARQVGLVASGNFYVSVDMNEAYLFAALGYDGVPGTDDDIQIISNSWGSSGIENDGWDYNSRSVDTILRFVNPNLTELNSTGNGAPGYGTVTSPGATLAVSVGASTLYGSTGVFDSPSSADQFQFNDAMSWSNRGPSALGENAVHVLANGAWGAGDLALNEAASGWAAWTTWGGTSRSTPVAAGVMSLVYQAFKVRTGRWPTNVEARAILMAGADKAYNDAFTEGAGTINALRAVNIAAGTSVGLASAATTTGGVYALPESATFGNYRGTRYEAFTSIMHPGQTATQEFTVYNTSSSDVTLAIRDEWLTSIGSYEFSFTSQDRSLEEGNSNRADYLFNLTRYIPAGTDLLEVKVAYPFEEFDPEGNYAQDSVWRAHVLDWTDINGDGKLWEDLNGNGVVNCPAGLGSATCEIQRGEYLRFTYGYNLGTAVQARVKKPLERMHDGIFLALRHSTRSAKVPVTHLKIQLNFYKFSDFPWLTTERGITVPANGRATFKATMAVPPLANVGLYNGVIRLTGAPSGEVSIPVVANVAAWSSDFLFGGPPDAGTPYDNGEVYGYFDWSWRAESGDWRFYFVDVPSTVKPGASFLVDTRWTNGWSDLDTVIMGPTQDCFSNGVGCRWPFAIFPGLQSVYGPYTLARVGGSSRNLRTAGIWTWQTTTGGPREIVAAPIQPGLNLIALQNVLFAGRNVAEPFVGQVGAIVPDPYKVDMYVGNMTSGSFPVSVSSSLPLSGLVVDAYGLGLPDRKLGLPQHQDDPDDPSTSFYKFPVTLEHAARLDVTTTAEAGDIDLFLLYDANGDGVFNFTAERIASSTTSTADEFISVKMPRDGNYLVAVHGWAAAPTTFDLVINAVQGRDMTVTNVPTGPFQPNQPINFTVNWTKTIPPGEAVEGLIVAGPAGAPGIVQIPVRLHNIVTGSETKTVIASEDAYLALGTPTTNFNTTVLAVGGRDFLRSVLRFDLSSINPIYPVTSAKLRLYVESFGSTGLPHDLRAYKVTKPWRENTVTWNAPWTKPGGDYVEPAAGSTIISNADVGKWIEVDVTSLAAGWVADPASNFGLLLRAVQLDAYAKFAFTSTEYWLPGFAPQLVVTYGVP